MAGRGGRVDRREQPLKEINRCPWSTNDPLYIRYHDEEWGVPLHDDRRLFEAIVLDGAQAGLSWLTILRKRENYRQAFDFFDPVKVAAYGEKEVQALLENPGIVRNRLKIASAIENAKRVLEIQAKYGSLDTFMWRFVDGQTRHNTWKAIGEIPASTPTSDAMSKALKEHGFRFVGSTICYALMQAVGMVNDHVVDCFRYSALCGMKS